MSTLSRPQRAFPGRALFYRQTKEERGLDWRQYAILVKDKLRRPEAILFAFVATHNHFVYDRSGCVSNKSAPGVKLTTEATEDDHLALLGLLNSSTACFWMKQVSYPKASAVGDISTDKGRPEANRYEFTGTGLLSFPMPSRDSKTESQIILISRSIDDLAQSISALLPNALLRIWHFGRSQDSISEAFALAAIQYEQIKQRMIALQEELDWEVYKAYGLIEEGVSPTVLSDVHSGIAPEHRPFLWASDTAPADLPKSWVSIYQRRRLLLNTDQSLKLIETLVFKRPWWGRQGVYGSASRSYSEWTVDACRDWLLDRLEEKRYWPDVELQSTARLADQASTDAEFMQVAAIYRGRPDFDVATLVAELVEGDSVPFLPVLRYKATGLRKRAVWERTWDLQRQEDAGKDVGDIPVPPKYTSADFVKTDYWRLRGKLDVPKERWVSYPHCSTQNDLSLVVGWAGWNHLQQATALIAYYDARKREGWAANRLTPLLAGLDQLLPWLHQWHPEIDKEYGETAGRSYQTVLEHDAHELGLTLEEIRNWQPPVKAKKTRKKKETEDDE